MAAEETPNPSDDWTYKLTDRLEELVGVVKSKTTEPATFIAKILVYGLIVGVLGAVLGLLAVVVLIRLLDVYLPFHPEARRVWTVDLVASAIFLGSGMFLWRKRRPAALKD